jgi:uncharacterized protein (TIGR02145 family)
MLGLTSLEGAFMKKIVRYGLLLLLAAALAVVALWLFGVDLKKPAQEQSYESVFEPISIIEPEDLAAPPPDTGTFTDDRDSASYKTAAIGGKTWLAENLRYRAKGSWCYGDDTSNCGKYGRLYNWKTAKTSCPTGWRLPTRLDWEVLAEAAGGGETAGKRLKAKAGWDEGGGGTDRHGFSALPGGSRHHSAGDFSYAGSIGSWWTSTEYEEGGKAYCRTINYGDNDVSEGYSATGGGLSVRCVRDD